MIKLWCGLWERVAGLGVGGWRWTCWSKLLYSSAGLVPAFPGARPQWEGELALSRKLERFLKPSRTFLVCISLYSGMWTQGVCFYWLGSPEVIRFLSLWLWWALLLWAVSTCALMPVSSSFSGWHMHRVCWLWDQQASLGDPWLHSRVVAEVCSSSNA